MDRKRICIVDDQAIIIDALTLIFEGSANIEIVGAFTSAESFISKYEYLQPDVTLMDLDLPGISGIEAIASIKLHYPDSKFLVLTNHNDDERLFNALKAGAGGYLLKKTSLKNIGNSILLLFDGGAPMSHEIARKVINYFQRSKNNVIGNFQMLNEKETLVLRLLADGFLYKEISDKLSLSIDIIKKTIQHIYNKLQVRTRSEAIKKYLKG